MSRLVGAVARVLMASVFIRGGINQVKKAHRLAPSIDAALGMGTELARRISFFIGIPTMGIALPSP